MLAPLYSTLFQTEHHGSVKHDDILDFAIYYVLHGGSYPDGLSKEKKRAVRKRAAKLATEKGEVFLLKKERRVKVVQTEREQKQILQACHSDPTSGHYGVSKTWNKVAERFYWKGMINDIGEMVSLALVA